MQLLLERRVSGPWVFLHAIYRLEDPDSGMEVVQEVEKGMRRVLNF